MTTVPPVEILVYPDDCDAFGHVNQAAFLRVFERARWEALARGPGMDVFVRHDAWPAVRKATVEFHAPAFPGDLLRIDTSLTHHGRTSFALHQTARRSAGDALVAEGEFTFVCVNESDRPTAVPPEVTDFYGGQSVVRPGVTRRLVVRGITAAVDVQGDGPVILFAHGFPLDRTMWRHLMPTVAGWRRIAPDLRGFGLSEAPDDGYAMSEYADDLAALLDALNVERAVVCGLSMGGYVALEFLRRHAERVRALVLANTHAAADAPEARRQRDRMIEQVERGGTAVLVDPMLERLLAPSSRSAMPQIVQHVKTMIESNPPAGVIGALRAMRDRADATELLGGITVPTLVVAGREDRLIPLAESKAMAGAIFGAQFTAIPEAGHLTPMEQPIATSRVIGEFLEALT